MSSFSEEGILYDLVTCVAVLAAVFATALPILYSRVQWEKTYIGRLFMLKTISISFAVDATLLFRIADIPLRIQSVIALVMYSALCISTALFFLMMWKLQHQPQPETEELT